MDTSYSFTAGVFRTQNSQMNERNKADWGATVAQF